MPMYYVYVLKINGEFYIGYTEDLQRRFKQHKTKGEVELIYYESYNYKKLATKREKKIKILWKCLARSKAKNNSLEGGVLTTFAC